MFQNPENYQTFGVCVTLVQFPIYAWILEQMAARGVPSVIVRPLMVGYLICLLAYPVVLIQWINSNILSGTYLMLFAVGLFLKLTSFHHVMGDNRDLMRRLDEIKKSKEVIQDKASYFDINPKTFQIASTYPENLRLLHYIRFLNAPTCCY